MSKQYEKSGVSLTAGYESVELITKHINDTKQKGVMSGFGLFGGMFDLSSLNYKEPVLISGTDGVGTKLKIAFMMDKHDTIGIDVVAMCVNDVLAQGAKPLFFLDYIATSKNEPQKIEQIVKGVAVGCKEAGAALIGGETAEMPDMYEIGEYDIAGFTVGAVEKSKIITGQLTKAGDVVIGLASSGIHSNGFSLVRRIVTKDNNVSLDTHIPELGQTIGEALLTPTKIYVKPILDVLESVTVNGIAHITGGGFHENMPRCLSTGHGIEINKNSWNIPPVFDYLQKLGNIDEAEMYEVFNMGIGMILVVDANDSQAVLDILKAHNQEASIIGRVVNGQGVSFV